ncbi:MAG: helicase C-terminal domain-containing protein, partial [Pyrobaculum sp.]
GCGVVCSGCGGDKVWYIAILKVLKEVLPKYGEVEIRTHFTHIPKDIFRMKLSERVEVKYVDEKDNLALKGIDKCLAKKMADPADAHQPPAAYSQPDDLHGWQDDFIDFVVDEVLAEGAPVIALSAPTGSGKTKAALEASKEILEALQKITAVNGEQTPIVVAVGKTKTQQEAFIRDNKEFGIGLEAVRLPNKVSSCIHIRSEKGERPPDWDDEEWDEYLRMKSSNIKCSECPLNFTPLKVDPDKLRQIVLQATYDMRGGSDEQYVEKIEREVRKELGVIGERESVCAYSVVKTAAKQMVADGMPILLVGTYPYALSSARLVVLYICTARDEGDAQEEDEEKDENHLKPRFCAAVVIMDEAHNLWETIGEYGKYTISDDRITRVAEGLADFCKEHPQAGMCTSLAEQLREACKKQPERPWCKAFKEGGTPDIVEVSRSFADELGRLAETNSSRKADRSVEAKVLKDVAKELREVLSDLFNILKPVCETYVSHPDKKNVDKRIMRAYIFWRTVGKFLGVLDAEKEEKEEKRPGTNNIYSSVAKIKCEVMARLPLSGYGIYSIVVKKDSKSNEERKLFVMWPIDLADRVETIREEFRGPWLLLSGTMDRDITEKLFGSRVHWYQVSVRFGRLSVYYTYSPDINLLTTRYGVGRNEKMYRRYAAAVQRVLKTSKGPLKLVVYPNREIMKKVRSYYTPAWGEDVVEVWEERDKTNSKMDIENLIRQGKTVHLHTVARGRYVEGIEFTIEEEHGGKKSVLGTVVVVGMPIPKIFNDRYVDLGVHFGFVTQKCAEELYRVRDLSETSKECMLQMVRWGYKLAEIEIRQIVGRAIRGPADSAVLYILDTRTPKNIIDAVCRNTHFHIEACRKIPAEELLDLL